MSNTVTITLGRGRTAEAAFNDASLAYGWTERVKIPVERVHKCTYGDLITHGTSDAVLKSAGTAFDSVKSTVSEEHATPESPVTITYIVTEEVNNPMTQIECGKNVWAKRVAELDSGAEVAAAKIRAEQAAVNRQTSVG